MLKRCSNCKHCAMDLRALFLASVVIEKCTLHGHHILNPVWKGWLCKDWRAEDDN